MMVATNEAPVTDVRVQVSALELSLASKRGELDVVEERIADARAARLLGEKIDTRRLTELGDRRDALVGLVTEEESLLNGLRARVDAFDAAVAQRRHAELMGQMEAVSAEAVAREAKYEALALELVATAGEMAAAAFRFSTLDSEAGRLEDRFRIARSARRAPHRAFVIPESFLAVSSRATGFPSYVAGKVANRRGWAGRETPPAPPPVETSSEPVVVKFLRDVQVKAEAGLHRVMEAGSRQELPAHEAAWLARDQPGSLEIVGAK